MPEPTQLKAQRSKLKAQSSALSAQRPRLETVPTDCAGDPSLALPYVVRRSRLENAHIGRRNQPRMTLACRICGPFDRREPLGACTHVSISRSATPYFM
jgi:hypothetical protein